MIKLANTPPHLKDIRKVTARVVGMVHGMGWAAVQVSQLQPLATADVIVGI